jgi:hypothetical protein
VRSFSAAADHFSSTSGETHFLAKRKTFFSQTRPPHKDPYLKNHKSNQAEI